MIWIGIAHVATSLPALFAGGASAAAASLAVPTLGGAAAWLRGSFAGFTPAVWGVVMLKVRCFLLLFLFFSILHIIQLTPRKLSAELENRPGAIGASAWPEDQRLHRGRRPFLSGSCVGYFMINTRHTATHTLNCRVASRILCWIHSRRLGCGHAQGAIRVYYILFLAV